MGVLFRGEKPSAEAIQNVNDKLDILVKYQGDKPFLAGQHATLADISMGTYLWRLEQLGATAPPSLKSWQERVNKAIPELAELNQQASVLLANFIKEKNLEF